MPVLVQGADSTRANAEAAMCDKCVELERQIDNFQRLHATTDDRLASALTAEAIGVLQAEKATLHPEDKEQCRP